MQSRQSRQSNFFQPQAKIIPVGLQYIIRKYDYDGVVKKVTFFGVELIFDSQTNLVKFKDQFYKLDKPQLQVFYSNYNHIGHLPNQHHSFCDLQIRINSPLYFLSRKDDPYPVIGEMIYEELDKHVELANVPVKDFDFNAGIFLEKDLPNDLLCPISLEEDVPNDLLCPISFEEDVPNDLLCPISFELMKDPITVSSGITYDRSSLVDLFAFHHNPSELNCPVTRLRIGLDQLTFKTSVIVKNLIDEYKKEKRNDQANHEPSRNFNLS